MQNLNANYKIPLYVLVTLGLVWIFFFYPELVTTPNQVMTTTEGDGIKNYFTFASHVKNSDQLFQFNGMNYPYGETIFYTDGHPVLSVSIKLLSHIIPGLEVYSVGIINSLMMASFLLNYLVLYFLLKSLKLNPWACLIFAFLINVLSPQIFRTLGHLSLSYGIVIPLTWLCLIKFFEGSKRNLILLFLTNIVSLFTHPYLGIMSVGFQVLYSVCYLFLTQKKSFYRHSLPVIIISIISIASFTAINKFTDNHIDRSDNPSGFFNYNAEIDDLLVAPFGVVRDALDWLTNGIIKLQPEALGYLGFFNSLLFIATLLLVLLSFFVPQTRKTRNIVLDNNHINSALICGLVFFLFAMAFPFKSFRPLIELIPIFKQLRATGRFIWPIYFTFSVFTAYNLSRFYFSAINSKKNTFLSYALGTILISVTLFEGYQYHEKVAKEIKTGVNYFNKNTLPLEYKEALKQIEIEKYQAIVSFPFFYFGSESFSRPRSPKATKNGFILSYFTQLPLVNSDLTRTSVSESKKIIQLVTPNYYKKPLQNDLTSDLPFLFVVSDEELSNYEKELISRATKTYSNRLFTLFEISKKELFADQTLTKVKDFEFEKPTLYADKTGFKTTLRESILFYNGFEKQPSDTTFRGLGAYSSVKKGEHTIASISSDLSRFLNKDCSLSLWMFNGEKDALNLWLRLIIRQFDNEGKVLADETFFPEQAETINGAWSLFETDFRIHKEAENIDVLYIGKNDSKALFHADDMLIKLASSNVYRLDSTKKKVTLFYNNHRLKYP